MLVLPSGSSGMRTMCVPTEVERTVAATASNVTASSRRKRAPLIVTGFPGEPTSGSTAVITGDGSAAVEYVKASGSPTLLAPEQRRVRGTVPAAACAGVEAITSVGPFTTAVRAARPSKNGQQPLVMFVPVILTSVLPPVPPKLGVTFDNVADVPRYVKPFV